MPNQFKCNNSSSTPTVKIESFNKVYDIYLDNKNNLTGPFTVPDVNWANSNCDNSSCPSNITVDAISNSKYFENLNGRTTMLNSDLARYLNDCATKITLDTAAPYYGSGGGTTKRYPQTITLRDVSYNNLLDDRNDLDRKMKEVLALQGSMVNEHQNYVDGSVYTTLLWTVMATSLVYYVFTKI